MCYCQHHCEEDIAVYFHKCVINKTLVYVVVVVVCMWEGVCACVRECVLACVCVFIKKNTSGAKSRAGRVFGINNDNEKSVHSCLVGQELKTVQ